MKSIQPGVLVLALFAVSTSHAQPIGPDVKLPGFDGEQSGMVYERGAKAFNDAKAKYAAQGGATKLSTREFWCGMASTMQGVIEAAAFHERGSLSAAQIAGAKKAISYLQEVQEKNCDRPKGGGLGSGNAGDRIVKAFVDANAPRARSLLDDVRDRLGTIFNVDAARAARDAVLAAAILAAGVALAPLWAT